MTSIPNPFVFYYSKLNGWIVAYRYMLGADIQFTITATCPGKNGRANAKNITELLNQQLRDTHA